MRRPVRWTFLLALLGARSALAAGSPLRAGLAVSQITPPTGATLVSYGIERTAERIHDPLFARILVLRTRDNSLALVTSDLYRFHSPSLVDRIRRELHIQHTILSSSHNASAPALDDRASDRTWVRATEEKIFQAVRQANENLFSAEISWGRGALIGGHNIRIRDNDTVRERWSNPEEEGTAPIDPSVTVIRVDQESGGPKAVLVHYSCEPAILGPDNRDISADYPGALARYVERELGRNVMCLFIPGAAANVYPFRSRGSGSTAFAEVERMGQRLGREGVRLARGLKASTGENALQTHEAVLHFDHRWQGRKEFQVGIETVLINDTLALLAVPAEMFIEFQIALSAKFPVPVTILVGSSHSSGASWAGYVPTITAASEGGFGASYGTDIEVGAGEAIVNQGVIQLYRFLGQLDDLPRGRLVVEIPDLPSP